MKWCLCRLTGSSNSEVMMQDNVFLLRVNTVINAICKKKNGHTRKSSYFCDLVLIVPHTQSVFTIQHPPVISISHSKWPSECWESAITGGSCKENFLLAFSFSNDPNFHRKCAPLTHQKTQQKLASLTTFVCTRAHAPMSCAAYMAPKCFFVSSVPFLDNTACLKRKKKERKHLVHITGTPANILLGYNFCFTHPQLM